jgi:brefeldin A-resistance guanine nucleotide exchange factor 1
MHSLARTAFAKLHILNPETEEAKLLVVNEETVEGEIKMTVPVLDIPTEPESVNKNAEGPKLENDTTSNQEPPPEQDESPQSKEDDTNKAQPPSASSFTTRPACTDYHFSLLVILTSDHRWPALYPGATSCFDQCPRSQ